MVRDNPRSTGEKSMRRAIVGAVLALGLLMSATGAASAAQPGPGDKQCIPGKQGNPHPAFKAGSARTPKDLWRLTVPNGSSGPCPSGWAPLRVLTQFSARHVSRVAAVAVLLADAAVGAVQLELDPVSTCLSPASLLGFSSWVRCTESGSSTPSRSTAHSAPRGTTWMLAVTITNPPRRSRSKGDLDLHLVAGDLAVLDAGVARQHVERNPRRYRIRSVDLDVFISAHRIQPETIGPSLQA